MDSYNSYRDSAARSPGDRTWGTRDDTRNKDDRMDTFYRSRSPGAFTLPFHETPNRRRFHLIKTLA